MRIGDEDLFGNLLMRVDLPPDDLPRGYLFRVRNRSWEPYLAIERFENGRITESVREPFTLHVDEDLMIEAGAVGDQLTLKVWPAQEAEPSTPQVEWSDSAFSTGLIGLEANIDGYATMFNRVDVIFDDIYFTPSSDLANAAAINAHVPEPTGLIGVLLAAACLAMLARRTPKGALVVALMLPVVCVVPVRGQSMEFDLGSFTVTPDDAANNFSLSIPAGTTYNSYLLTTNWSNTGGNAWSQEAHWIVADGALGEPDTQYYVNPGKASNGAGNNSSVQLVWEGWFDIPLSGPRDVTLIAVETFPNSSARWANTVLELSYHTPPMAPTLDVDFGTIAHEFGPFSIVTTGDLDSELAVYSSTGEVLAKNDDAIGTTVNSELSFDYGLPAGRYIAAVGGFNTTFADGYGVTPGASSGDYGLNVAGKSAAGALAAGQVSYVGFSVSTLGDVNGDHVIDVKDIDDLSSAIQSGSTDLVFDLNHDKMVSSEDRQMLVSDILQTWFGDANLDREFNSTDFVGVFLAGKYEAEQSASWSEGDWDGDLVFASGDFVTAFLDGGYELGPKLATNAVPEPTSFSLALLAVLAVFFRRPSAGRLNR